MPETRFADFLATSLQALDRELPQAYALLCTHLAGQQLAIEVDGEMVGLSFAGGRARLLARAAPATVHVVTSRALIFDLIDARCTLLQAVLSDRLLVRGAPQELLAFHDGLLAYLHGAVRAPSFPPLLRAYRSAARP